MISQLRCFCVSGFQWCWTLTHIGVQGLRAGAAGSAVAAELVALVQGLQQAETRSAFLSGSAVTEPPVTSVAQGLQQQHPASTRVAPIEQLSSTAVLETPQREFLYGLSRDAPTAQVPTYSSCPTAVEEPLTPCPSPFRACCTTAVPPQ